MTISRHRHGFTVAEVLISVVVLGVLLFAVGSAVTHVLHMELSDASHVASERSGSQLAIRFSEEARSCTAVFIPALDVFGNINGAGSAVHEVDFFRRLSAGGDSFVAYHFDARNGDVIRYEYSLSNGRPSITTTDLAASGIISFDAQRTRVNAASDVVDAASIKPVSVYYGEKELVGGNDIVDVTFGAKTPGAAVPQSFDVHLSAKAAPTNLAILVPAAPPKLGASGESPTPPGSSKVIPFEIKVLNPNLFGAVGVGLIPSQPQFVSGTATITGPGSVSWLEFHRFYPLVTDGLYVLDDGKGNKTQIQLSCKSAPCPEFIPLPKPSNMSVIVFDST